MERKNRSIEVTTLSIYSLVLVLLTFAATKYFYVKEYAYVDIKKIIRQESDLAAGLSSENEVAMRVATFKKRIDTIVQRKAKSFIIFFSSQKITGAKDITDEVAKEVLYVK